MLSKFQYISQGNTITEQAYNIKQALDHGADWIQVRWKNATINELLNLCTSVKNLCSLYNATCIINDDVAIAQSIDADGVHLGLNDTKIVTARLQLDRAKIIGGTANNLKDVLQRIDEGCDYIGLGPYRYTITKENLSPVLGLKGYQNIMNILEQTNVTAPPIFAIGGITQSDIQNIRNTGIYGIAVSGLITKDPTLITTIKSQLS